MKSEAKERWKLESEEVRSKRSMKSAIQKKASTNTSPQHREECTTAQTQCSAGDVKSRDDRFTAFLHKQQDNILRTLSSSAMTAMGHAYVAKSSVAGSGVFASQDIVAGDLIFTLARPAIAALDTKKLDHVCANCFASAADPSVLHGEANEQVTVKACTGCKTLKYCSKVCCDCVSYSLESFLLPCDFATLPTTTTR